MSDPEIWKQLRAEFVPRAREDETAAITLEVEQARLVLYGCLGALAIIFPAAFASTKPVCTPMLEMACGMLAVAAPLGWNAIGLLTAARTSRSNMSTTEMLQLQARNEGRDPTVQDAAYREAAKSAYGARRTARWFTLSGSILGWIALSLVLAAAGETMTGKCSASVWDAIANAVR